MCRRRSRVIWELPYIIPKGKIHDIIAALLLLARLAGEGSLRAVLVFYWLSPLSLYVTY